MTLLDISSSEVFLRFIGFLLFIFHFHIFPAQELPDHKNQKSATISLGNGTKIFSIDESFNQQILQEKIKVNPSQISYERESQKLIVSKADIKKTNDKSFSFQVKAAQKKKEEKDLLAVQENIERFEKRKASFQNVNVLVPFSSSHFFHEKHFAQECAIPSLKSNVFSRIQATAYSFIVKLSLDHLHAQKYTFYNNKSLDDCYAPFFSVRPPPVLV